VSEDSERIDRRVCVVTGANAGVGLAIAEGLAARGGHVVLACRSSVRGQRAVKELRERHPAAKVELALVDLSSQSSIRDFAAWMVARHPRIHVLVNNAGVWSSYRQETCDGIERTWATNVLGYFLLTDLLRGALLAAAPARIINVASGLARGLDLDDVEFNHRPYRGVDAYAQSKQADRMLSWALARRLRGTGVTANAIHPGFTRTEAFSKGGGVGGKAAGVLARVFGRSPEASADTAVWLATNPRNALVTGGYWQDRKFLTCPWRDSEQQERLWQLCEQMTARSVWAEEVAS
jgi:NAD(P)-dependent dehydrogenase (short-subunit alcohol dehydrogenase family)